MLGIFGIFGIALGRFIAAEGITLGLLGAVDGDLGITLGLLGAVEGAAGVGRAAGAFMGDFTAY